MKYYFIDTKNKKTTLGFVNVNRIEELNTFENSELRDDIFVGKIVKELPSISGYVIELEKDKKECIESRFLPEDVKLGDEVIVQLYKKTGQGKFDKYSMEYSVSGKHIIYYPTISKNIFSKKIKKESLKYFLKENDISDFEGVTFRTNSINQNPDLLKNEYESLKKINEYIVKQSKFLPIPRKIYSNIKFIYESISKSFDYIITNDKEKYQSLKNYFEDKNIIYDENYDFQYDENISKDLISLESKIIPILKDSNIVIEKTEALTVIDVNSGKNDNFLEVNKNAVLESLRQVELRNSKGIILVDAITLKKEDLDNLVEFIKEKVKYYDKIKFLGISNTGLLEFVKTGVFIDN